MELPLGWGLRPLSTKHVCPASCLNAAIRRVDDWNSWCCVRSVAIKRVVLSQEGDEEATKATRSNSKRAGHTIKRRAVILPVTSQWIANLQLNLHRAASKYVHESYLRDQTVAIYIHSCRGHGGSSWRLQVGVDSVSSLVNWQNPISYFSRCDTWSLMTESNKSSTCWQTEYFKKMPFFSRCYDVMTGSNCRNGKGKKIRTIFPACW